MDNLQILATILLLGRFLAIRNFLQVAKVQKKLLRLPIDDDVWDFRRRLHAMTVALLISCVPSVVLDIAVMLGVEETTPYLVVYAIANMLSAVIASKMIHKMYALAANTKEVNDLEVKHMKNDHKV